MSDVITTHNAESRTAPRYLDLSAVKPKTGRLEHLGGVIVRKNRAKVYWGENKPYEEKESDEEEAENSDGTREDNDEGMPFAFRRLLSRKSEPRTVGCVEIEMLHDEDGEATQVLVSGMNDSEWWTMVSRTVSNDISHRRSRHENRNSIRIL